MIEIIDLTEREKWDRIVRSFKQYDIYYLSGYVRAFEINGDGKALLFYYHSGNNRAINVVMQRDIADIAFFAQIIEKNKYYDLKTPYGYGGFLLEGFKQKQDYVLLEKEYTAVCQKNNFVCEVMKFHPVLKNYKYMNDIFKIEKIGYTISLDIKDEMTIWQNMSSKNRNMIRKARKNNLVINFSQDKEIMKKFIALYNAVMQKHRADSYYFFTSKFYESILHDLRENYLIFYACYKEHIISAAIILLANKNIHYHLSASDYKYSGLAATNLLLYEAARYGCANGYKYFHLGGGVGAQIDSLYKFKKSFYRQDDCEFWLGEKIFLPETYNFLSSVRKTSKENYLFPYYRAMKRQEECTECGK